MVKGFKKLTITSIVLLVLLIAVNIFAYNGEKWVSDLIADTKLDEYSTDINITADGKAHIVETHNVDFDSRDRDWWNYYKVVGFSGNGTPKLLIDTLKFKVDGKIYPMYSEQIDFENDMDNVEYHSRYANYSYYNESETGKIEFGVVMPDFDKGKRKIEIEYSVENILMEGSDIAYLYYKFIDEGNRMPIKKFNAKVTFPKNSEEMLRTWLHITGAMGTSKLEGNNTLLIEASDIPANTYVETRTTLDKANYSSFAKTTIASFSTICAEEKADYEASVKEGKKLQLFIVVDVLVGVVFSAVCIFVAVKSFMSKKRAVIDNAPEYLHEPPKDYDMEEAMPILHYYDEKDDWWPDVLSGTIMNLVRKKYLQVMPGEKKKEAVLLIVNNDRDSLKPYEKIVMDMIAEASGGCTMSMNVFEDWCKKNYIKVDKMIDKYKADSKKKSIDNRLCVYGNKTPSNRGFVIAIIGLVMSIAAVFAGNPFFIANIMVGVSGLVLHIMDHLRYRPLNKAGERKYLEFEAFMNYMLDFSNFDEKTIPELALWEEYMVWATGMGIADEVSKQLSIVYPEINNDIDISVYGNNIPYWYLYTPSFRRSFNINQSMRMTMNSVQAIKVQQAVSKMTSSDKGGKGGSGSGFGGGSFSGGGGGFSGGGMGAR